MADRKVDAVDPFDKVQTDRDQNNGPDNIPAHENKAGIIEKKYDSYKDKNVGDKHRN